MIKNLNHHINRPSATDSIPTASECSYVSSSTGPGREVRDGPRRAAHEAVPTHAIAQILAIDVKPPVSSVAKRRSFHSLRLLSLSLFINIVFL